MTTVTIVTTASAAADNLTAADYRDNYDELREKASLDKFVTAIGSTVSKAWWSKYERGEVELTYARRNELRRAVGLPLLPARVIDVTARIDQNATIYQVGDGVLDRVIMIGDQERALTMRLNGTLELLSATGPEKSLITVVTSAENDASRATRHRHRPQYFRPCLSLDLRRRIPQLEALLAAAISATKS